jgi:hypothetical protein
MGEIKHERKTLMLLSNSRFIKTLTPHEPVGNIDYFNATLLREECAASVEWRSECQPCEAWEREASASCVRPGRGKRVPAV